MMSESSIDVLAPMTALASTKDVRESFPPSAFDDLPHLNYELAVPRPRTPTVDNAPWSNRTLKPA
eukprot:7622348-Pyramimonas_sp.AAC.1